MASWPAPALRRPVHAPRNGQIGRPCRQPRDDCQAPLRSVFHEPDPLHLPLLLATGWPGTSDSGASCQGRMRCAQLAERSASIVATTRSRIVRREVGSRCPGAEEKLVPESRVTERLGYLRWDRWHVFKIYLAIAHREEEHPVGRPE